MRWVRRYRSDWWIMEGEEVQSGAPFSMLCAAPELDRNYLASLAFSAGYQEYRVARDWIWSSSKIYKNLDRPVSAILVAHESRPQIAGRGSFFHLPQWINGRMDLPYPSRVLTNRSVKSDLRRIRKNDLGWVVSKELSCLEDFYNNMFVPYTRSAHGSRAFVRSFEELRARFSQCELLFVTHDQRTVAGILIDYTGKDPALWTIGVRDGDPDYLRMGVVGAVYAFSGEYLQGQGHKVMGTGMSRSFLHDGVLNYKKKWGQEISGMYPALFSFSVVDADRGARAFLQNNPFVFLSGGRLNAAVFVEGNTLSDAEQLCKDFCHTGLERMFVYLLDAHTAPSQDMLPSSLHHRVVLQSAMDVVG